MGQGDRRSAAGSGGAVRPPILELEQPRGGEEAEKGPFKVDESPRVAARYRVQGIPTLLLLDRGQLTDRQVGALPADACVDGSTPSSPTTREGQARLSVKAR